MRQGSDGTWYAGPQPGSRGRWRGVKWLGRAFRTFAFAVGRAGKRAIESVPWSHGGVSPAAVSAERALQLVPLFACVRLLADNIASLPLQAFRRNGDQREPVRTLPPLLANPAVVDNTFQWVHKAVVSLALRGNAYGLIVARDGFGFPTMIEWQHPDDVYVDETNAVLPRYYVMGTEVPRERIVHIPWLVQPGRVKGLSPVQAFAATIGVGLSVTDYGRSWFDGGGHPPAKMKNSRKTLNPKESEEISDRLAARMRARKPLVYGEDWDFEAIQVNPEESQFIETMRLNATQIAAIYGVPPEKVGGSTGDSLTYSTVEMNQLDLITSTLRPWLVRLETALSALLPGRMFVRFNADAMIRTDLLSRYQAHGLRLKAGWGNRNEVRALEDLPPIPGGDQYVIAQEFVAVAAANESR